LCWPPPSWPPPPCCPANYVLVRDIATAVGLSAFAVVVGPFVYLGHEKLWDYYGSPREPIPDSPAPVSVVPASA